MHVAPFVLCQLKVVDNSVIGGVMMKKTWHRYMQTAKIPTACASVQYGYCFCH